MTNQPERIPLNQARSRVGMAMYGANWIGQLTERERWLLERYVEPKVREVNLAELLTQPPSNELRLRSRPWINDDPPPALRSEIDQAKDRHEWRLSQHRRVSDWLVQHGMDVRIRREKGSLIIPRHVEKQLFERAFEAEFSTRRDRRLNEAGSETRVHRPPSREKPFWSAAKKVGMEWLEENGCPQKGDGNQAQLEKHIADWLSGRGYDAAENTIRRHVKGWMEEFRERIGM